MPQTIKTIRDELYLLENALWDELTRLFRDVDRWQLEDNDYDSKSAYFNAYDIDDDGKIRLSFLVVGYISAFDVEFDRLARKTSPRHGPSPNEFDSSRVPPREKTV